MICRKCNTKKIVKVLKKLSQKDTKEKNENCFLVCKKCEPLLASFCLIEDGYSEIKKLLSDKKEE